MAAKQGYKYVIEHMEEDDDTTKVVPPWVQLEYAQMLKHAGPQSEVFFTSLSSQSAEILPKQLEEAVAKHGTPVAKAHATTTPILTLLSSANPPIPISKVCLLDPKAERVLSPEDGEEGVFEYFLFGGILGDDPPRDRTGELRRMGFETRHLGSVQMTTDTAERGDLVSGDNSYREFKAQARRRTKVFCKGYRALRRHNSRAGALGVSKRIIDDKIPLDKIPYVDHPTIRFTENEAVEMPFRYIKGEDGEPILPAGMRELLRDDLNKSFDEF
ncbi:hypothetical protein QFC24_006875 [Naganishia onofrii]|uniref:Uncharacterized protein n=1 Tax=Naganishia onofrii TaxID=1851511 RepID=A0ACC2WXL2_9TREE|nr:hypothetical protein QFC24_006875 [Naganishia onofrii]